MRKYGCHLSVSKGFFAMAQTACTIGADTIQFFTRNPRGGKAKEIDEEDMRRFREFAAEHQLGQFLAHAPYTLNPCSSNPETRQFAWETMEDDLKRLECIPDSMYNFHPGSHTGQGIQTGIQQITQLLNHVLRKKQTTMVLLETMAGKGSEVGNCFEELKQIIDGVECGEHVGVCLDTCHVFDAGYNITEDLDGILDQFDRVIGIGRLRAIHCNDSMNVCGSHKDRHACLGQGKIGLETFEKLVNHPYLRDIPFYLETPNTEAGYGEEIRLLKAMQRP